MSKRTVFITFPIILLFGIYFLGPAPDAPKWSQQMPAVPQSPDELEAYVASQEAKHQLKQDNQARIIWADSSRTKTEYSVVYIHGFSASQGEGDPVHKDFAKAFGCNLYLARLSDHGVDTTEQLLYFTPDRAWESSKEALAIGKALGEKVILMSTSSGGTLALVLAATYPADVFALINMSPNIALKHPLGWIANNPWGLQIARIVQDGKYNITPVTADADTVLDYRYWNHKYRLEAVSQLEELLETSMNKETFEKISQPSLTLYYFKNEQEQDNQVRVSAMIEMNSQLKTPDSLKVMVPLPEAGGHVLGSNVVSKDVEGVKREIWNFAIQKLKIQPVNQLAQTP